MGVPLQTATQWELDQQYQIPASSGLPRSVQLVVHEHFKHARTTDWMTRLADYRAFQGKKRADEERHGKYGWINFRESYRDNIEPGRASGESSPAMFLRLLHSNPNGPHDAGADIIAYKLRSTIAMHRQARLGTEFHGFMHLPPEIRNTVYSYLLLKGRVIVPNYVGTGKPGLLHHWGNHRGETYVRYQGLERQLSTLMAVDGKRKPLGLIQGVSRTVHAEATRMYFSSNRFVLPVGDFLLPSRFNYIDQIIGDDLEEMYTRYLRACENGTNNAPLVRDVSYAFDLRDYETNDYENLCYNDRIRDAVDDGSIVPGEAMRRLHDQKTFSLEVAWVERVDAIQSMSLNRLQLDFEECYCAMGCCRKVDWLLDRFLYTDTPPGTDDTPENAYSMVGWRTGPPQVIEVSGWKNDREEALIREKLGKMQSSSGSIEIRFRPHTNPEEQPVFDADERPIHTMLLETQFTDG
ncbi:hypothetical protein VPNG_02642 [Cytospora leucostoma]|uniref:Uncharacterized protein n=1 Tax=Cytospora leucostoma TaxID=1230097 RepID=A0A423XIE6_9PEZI|nr:hypothetical protein VPNG_02642 [Cytospora leucostoma]